jgi:penicillin-binding protein 2
MSVIPPRDQGDFKNVYRFGMFVLAAVIGVTALTARLFFLQVLPGTQTGVQVAGTTESTALNQVDPSRGLIYTADGKALVKNVVDYAVTVTPSDLPLDQEPAVAARLGSILNVDPVSIEVQIDSKTGSLYLPVKIADGIDAAVARFIQENSGSLPGVKVVVTSKREYLTQQLFAEIVGYEGQITSDQYKQLASLGYTTEDIVGQAGLEGYYEQALRGTPGTETVALDTDGKPIPGLVTPGKPAVPGDTLTLNLDYTEQSYAQLALQTALTKAHVTKGVIIVENPQNGKILAMVSLPSYNDQLFADGISDSDFQALLSSPDQPLLNKAIGAQYAPGSTFKLVTATAGLVSGPPGVVATQLAPDPGSGGSLTAAQQLLPSIDTTTKILSQPFIRIGDYTYSEWNKKGWGPLDVYQGIANSSDTFFYQLAEMVGLTKLTYWADQYGFGKPTGIDLPETATGIVPTDAWKRANEGLPMFEGELAQAGIGQGYDAATPLQLLNAYSALANGGTVWEPQVVQSITDGLTGKVNQIQPVALNHLHAADGTPVSQQVLADLRQATRDVVTSRHTYNLVDIANPVTGQKIAVAGKTGTAEFGNPDKHGVLPYHEWFVGYVPANPYVDDFSKPDSQLAVVAFIYGGDTWGNVATEVVKNYLMLHYGLISREALAFDSRTPGYSQSWIYKTTNFYSPNGRD